MRFNDSDRSWNSAKRWRMISKAPPASPALIMFIYSRLKALGTLDMASESVAPLSISSQTSISAFFMAPGGDCSWRIFRLRNMGNPASCNIDNWRVKVVNVLVLMPPMAKVLPFFAVLLFEGAARLFLTDIFVTNNPICRIVACASSWLGASSTSLISCPVASMASN